MIEHDRSNEEVIDLNVEKALDLGGMQVEGEDAIGTGAFNEIGDEAGGDRNTGLVFAILAGIAEVGENGSDTVCGGALEGIDDEEQLHQIMVDWGAGGLNDEDVGTANIFVDLNPGFAVGECLDGGAGQLDVEMGGNLLRKGGVRSAG